MSMKVVTSLNMGGNEILNLVIQNLASDPSSPSEGQIYFNTTTGKFRGYSGGAFSDIGSSTVTLSGDVSGSSDSNTVDTVGGKTAAAIAAAVDASHAQNTDTGTSSVSFQLDNGGSGNRVKNSGTEIQFRNAADNGFSDAHVNGLQAEGDVTVEGNLTVNGSTTTLNTTTVETDDNEIVLNSGITTAAGNIDGGVSVKRLDADNVTRRDARISFDETADRWEAEHGAHTAATVSHTIALKHSAVIGDGAATQFTITHNLNTYDVCVEVMENSGTYNTVIADVERTSVNAVRISFVTAPTSNQYRVNIVG